MRAERPRAGGPRASLLAAAGLAAGLAWGPWGAPAEALLGGSPYHVRHSPLLQGERYFRYEGRVGSRYFFGGATYCAFGTGLMAFDTINGHVVQQTLVLPVPTGIAQERLTRQVVRMFMEEAGLLPDEIKQAMGAFQETWTRGKVGSQSIGKSVELRSFLKPELRTVMLVLALRR